MVSFCTIRKFLSLIIELLLNDIEFLKLEKFYLLCMYCSSLQLLCRNSVCKRHTHSSTHPRLLHPQLALLRPVRGNMALNKMFSKKVHYQLPVNTAVVWYSCCVLLWTLLISLRSRFMKLDSYFFSSSYGRTMRNNAWEGTKCPSGCHRLSQMYEDPPIPFGGLKFFASPFQSVCVNFR